VVVICSVTISAAGVVYDTFMVSFTP
jgi:hypothetical protein